MTSMIYNSAGNIELTRAQLAGLHTPPPMGAFHQPYSFEEFVETIHHGLDQSGIKVVGEEYVTAYEGMRLFGALELELPAIEGEYIPAEGHSVHTSTMGRDHKIVLGLRGSHDQSITRGLALGSQVFVCSNLCFSGNLGNISTKQTLNIGSRLPGLIRSAIELIPQEAEKNVIRFDRYRNTDLRSDIGDSMLVEIFRRGGLSAPQLGKAALEWKSPKHEEHAEQGFTAWRLFNACTEAVKPGGANSNPMIIEERTGHISSYMDECVGLH